MAGLLSLPAPVAGLLAPGVEANARNMALMQVAGALLQAGGPNMRPTSPGQALGAAVPGAMATYQNTVNSGIQQGLLGRQIEQQDAQAAREAQQRQAVEQYVSTLPPDQQAMARAYGDNFQALRADQMSEKEFAAEQQYKQAQLALSRAASARAAAAARIQMQAAQQAMEDAKRERVARERIANAAAMGGVDMAGRPVDMKGLLLGTQAGQEAAVNSLLAQTFPTPGKLTDDMKEFEYATARGFSGSFEDWMRIRSPQTNIYNGGANLFSQPPQATAPAAPTATSATPNINDAVGAYPFIADKVNSVTGIFGGTFDPSVEEANNERRAIDLKVTELLATGFGGRPSNFTLQQVQSRLPGNLNTPGAVSKYKSILVDLRDQRRIASEIAKNPPNATTGAEAGARAAELDLVIRRIETLVAPKAEGVSPAASDTINQADRIVGIAP